MTLLYRAELRQKAFETLKAQIPHTTILIGQHWPLADVKLPALLLDFRGESKRTSADANGPPTFDVTGNLVVRARDIVLLNDIAMPASFLTSQRGTGHGPAAEAVLDLWIERIQDALLKQADFVTLANIPSMTVETQVSQGDENIIAEAGVTFNLAWEETYEPRVPDTFAGIRVRLDAIDPADPHGTYPPVPGFPDAATPPRDRGPDGRAEVEIDITLPTAP